MGKGRDNNGELIRNNLPSALLAEYDAITEDELINPPSPLLKEESNPCKGTLGIATKKLYTLCRRYESSSRSILLWSLFWTIVASEFGRPGHFVIIGYDFQVFHTQ